MLLIDKYIMNDAMNYEIAEEVACVRNFIKRLFIFKALCWWPLFLIVLTLLLDLDEDINFEIVLIFDAVIFCVWYILLCARDLVLYRYTIGEKAEEINRIIAKYESNIKVLAKIKVILRTSSGGTFAAVRPLATHSLKKVIKSIRRQVVVPKKERWTVVVYRDGSLFQKERKHYTY